MVNQNLKYYGIVSVIAIFIGLTSAAKVEILEKNEI